jgi:hypothetical protein
MLNLFAFDRSAASLRPALRRIIRGCANKTSPRGAASRFQTAANGRDAAPQAKAQTGQVVPGFAGFLALGALTGFR